MTVNESIVLILQYVAMAGAIFVQQSKNFRAPYLHICLFFNLPSPSKKVDEKKEREDERIQRKRKKEDKIKENKKKKGKEDLSSLMRGKDKEMTPS